MDRKKLKLSDSQRNLAEFYVSFHVAGKMKELYILDRTVMNDIATL